MDRLVLNQAPTLVDELARVDLNLLVPLEMLLQYRNLTHAARRLGQTQPTMSRALARLRNILGDDLLVRGSGGMRLTARGEHLAKDLPAIMSNIRGILSAGQTMSSVNISIDHSLVPALLPHLMKWKLQSKEQLRISVHKFAEDGFASLRADHAQFSLTCAAFDSLPGDMDCDTLIQQDWVSLMAVDPNNMRSRPGSRLGFLSSFHVRLIANGRELFPQVTRALHEAGVGRSQLVDVADTTSAGLLAMETGYILTVPRAVANCLTNTLRLSAQQPPIAIAGHGVQLFWNRNSSLSWCRKLVGEIGSLARLAMAGDYPPGRSHSVATGTVN